MATLTPASTGHLRSTQFRAHPPRPSLPWPLQQRLIFGVSFAIVNAVIPMLFESHCAQDRNLFSAESESREEGEEEVLRMGTVAAIGSSTREKLERARAASALLAQFSTEDKNRLLLLMADAIEAHAGDILRANEQDIAQSNLSGAMLDRLLLNPKRIKETATAVRDVAALADPVNEVLAEWARPTGFSFAKCACRWAWSVSCTNPALTSLQMPPCSPSKPATRSSFAAARSRAQQSGAGRYSGCGTRRACGAIELLDSSTRETVAGTHHRARSSGCRHSPRRPRPDFARDGECHRPRHRNRRGNCHIFVDQSADLEMASRIVINAKTQRPSSATRQRNSWCTRHRDHLHPQMVRQLINAGVEVRGDAETCRLSPDVKPAIEADWGEEYLRLCMAVRVVSGVDEPSSTSIGTPPSTRNPSSPPTKRTRVNSCGWWIRRRCTGMPPLAFTDGGEFGFGAEMGVSTQKLHCRGPFALAELTSSKYQVIGTGQIR